MSNEKLMYTGALLAMTFLLLGLAGFMYDKITKEIPDEDKDMSIKAPSRKLTAIFNAPFTYLIQNLKEKNFRSIIPFTLYILDFIYIIFLAYKLNQLQ